MTPTPGHLGEGEAARLAISLLDLTNLNDDCSQEDVDALCARARTPYADTAAVCIWPRFVAQAKASLKGTSIRVATVVNFPAGETDIAPVVAETRAAIADGADEIDLVLPWRAFLDGDEASARAMVEAVRAACPEPVLLKVILETGELADPQAIAAASRLAISAGADFIKTSTGKVGVNATPGAVRIMLEAIRESGRPVGIKPSGGIKSVADCAAYLELARDILGGDWISPRTFRFGASGVLASLLSVLEGSDHPEEGSGGGY